MDPIESQRSEDAVVPPQKQKMSWWKKTLIGLVIAVPVGWVLAYVVPVLILTIELRTPPPTTTPSKLSMDEMVDRLNYEDIGEAATIKYLYPTRSPLITIEGDVEDFTELSDRIIELSNDDPRLLNQCQTRDQAIVCGKEIEISSRFKANKIRLEIRDRSAEILEKGEIPRERSLSASIATVESDISYYVANTQKDDKCRWDENSDGSFTKWKDCDQFSVAPTGKIAKMTVEIKDKLGVVYTLHNRQVVIDPKDFELLENLLKEKAKEFE